MASVASVVYAQVHIQLFKGLRLFPVGFDVTMHKDTYEQEVPIKRP